MTVEDRNLNKDNVCVCARACVCVRHALECPFPPWMEAKGPILLIMDSGLPVYSSLAVTITPITCKATTRDVIDLFSDVLDLQSSLQKHVCLSALLKSTSTDFFSLSQLKDSNQWPFGSQPYALNLGRQGSLLVRALDLWLEGCTVPRPSLKIRICS